VVGVHVRVEGVRQLDAELLGVGEVAVGERTQRVNDRGLVTVV